MKLNSTEGIRQHVKCCCCEGSLAREHTKHINLIHLDGYRAEWDYPTCGNFITGESGGAVAFLCDACHSKLTHKDKDARIKFAVEYRGEEVIYHPLSTLKRKSAT